MRSKTLLRWITFVAVITLVVAAPLSGPASAKIGESDQVGFTLWRSAEGAFTGWDLSGTALNPLGELVFSPTGAAFETDPYPAGGYYGGNFYTGGSYWVGEALSPVVTSSFSFTEAIASWNASTPSGTWLEVLIRAELAGRWTKWYNLGIWASDDSTIGRHSVRLQGDADGYVAVDTLVISDKKIAASAYQLKVRLFSLDGAASPTLRSLSVAYSTAPPKKAQLSSGSPALWNTLLPVPKCSQMVYPDGGTVWCSPTSTSMVVAYWTGFAGPCEPVVRHAVDGVFDWLYDGHGNWPFNTAYAASLGLEAYVVRFTSLDMVEPWIAAGVPVVVSFDWKKNDLTGAPISSSPGHLAVIVGFDGLGNPIVNDPAAASDDEVQRTYLRSELEKQWLEASGGTVYLIYPVGWSTPSP